MSKDKIVTFPTHEAKTSDNNRVILERMQGAEVFTIMPALRWNNGVLEQLHQGSAGTFRWEPVPDKDSALSFPGGTP